MSKSKAPVMRTVTGKKKGFWYNVKKYRILLLMCLPAVAYFIIFAYVPMPGIYVAFTNYNYRNGIFGSQFVGMKNFQFLWRSGKLWMLTRNTVLYNVAFIFLGNALQIFIALLLNEVQSRMFKKVSQTIMFLPYFISAVLVGLLAYNLFNYDYGFINSIMKAMGGDGYQFYAHKEAWPPIMVALKLWQGTGYGSVVYFAAICGIDSEIIEAAKVDGANGFQKIHYIILPSLKGTIIVLLLFAIGGIMKGDFGLFYNVIGSNSVLYDTTDIIETYVYRSLKMNSDFATSSASGVYQSVFGFALVLFSNWVVKKLDPDYALF